MNLKDKVIIVTGGSGLLGREFLKNIKSKGAIAINIDINIENDYEKNNFFCDITSTDSIIDTIENIIKAYGRIDGLVNNAYPRTEDWGSRLEDTSYESWAKNVNMQMNSVFLLIKKVMPELIKTNGSIVNIASIYGVVGNDFTVYESTDITPPAAYSAIKGGLINFSRYMASCYGRQNVRINCVSPGGIKTNQNPVFVKNYEHKVPLKRMGNPDDIAPAVSFLLSDEAKYITGQNLIIDGGWTAI